MKQIEHKAFKNGEEFLAYLAERSARLDEKELDQDDENSALFTACFSEVGPEAVKGILAALQHELVFEHLPKLSALWIDLSNSNELVFCVVELLSNKRCRSALTVGFRNNLIGNDLACAIAGVLFRGDCPADLTLELWANDIDDVGVGALAGALTSDRCPVGLTLDLSGNDRIGSKGAEVIAQALISGSCPSLLTLKLKRNDIGDLGIQELAKSLASGGCPSGLTLILHGNGIKAAGAAALAKALASGNCPPGLTLDLKHNFIGDAGAKEIAAALISGSWPVGLTLDLSSNGISDVGALAIAEALERAISEGNCPEKLKIKLEPSKYDRKISPEVLDRIACVLERNNQLNQVEYFCVEQSIEKKIAQDSRYEPYLFPMIRVFLGSDDVSRIPPAGNITRFLDLKKKKLENKSSEKSLNCILM